MHKLFNKINVNQQNKLLKLLESSILSFPKNTIMLSTVKENIIGIILEGSAQIIRTDYNGNRTIIEELEEESIFGTVISSLSSDECEMITKDETKVLIIDYDRILESENNNYSYYNQFIKNLLSITNNVIEQKNERIEVLTKKTIRDKLLEYFKQYSKKKGSKRFKLPMTYTDLASYLSVDRSAMTREIKYLKNEGFIETENKIITIKF